MVTTLFGQSENYRKLSRARITLLGSLSLWEGADHFVQMEVLGFSETHKRFYFEDIKAFTVCRSRRGLWLHFLFGIFTSATAAIAAWAFQTGHSSGGPLDWLMIAVPVFFAIGWLVHVALGPTCSCHVITPVQYAKLGALSRVPRARKVIGYLARRAEISQGGPVGMEAGMSIPAPPLADRLPAPVEWTPDVSHNAGWRFLYPLVSSVSLLNAACLFGLFVWDSFLLRAVQVLFILVLMGLGITCAASSRKKANETASWFRWIGWALFSVNGVVFLLWYGYGIYRAGLARTRAPAMELNYLQEMLRVSPHGSRLWFWVVLVNACFSMFIGLMGLLVIVFGKEKRVQAERRTE